MATVATSPDEEPDDREKAIRDIVARLSAIEARLDQIPTPSELGHELPISRVEVDKYLKIQRDGINLTIQVNTDQLKRDLAAGGLGGSSSTSILWAGWLRIDAILPTGVVDARGNPVQWEYTVTQVVKGPAGYGEGTWIPLVGGYSGLARNLREAENTGIGVQGNGIDHDGADYPAGFLMITAYDPMAFWFVVNENGDQEAWFDVSNAEDGLCSGSAP